MEFHIADMVCGGCVRGVTRAVQSVDPKAEINANPDTHTLQLKTSASREEIAAALASAGFPVSQ